jgi:hypothetical protein
MLLKRHPRTDKGIFSFEEEAGRGKTNGVFSHVGGKKIRDPVEFQYTAIL